MLSAISARIGLRSLLCINAFAYTLRWSGPARLSNVICGHLSWPSPFMLVHIQRAHYGAGSLWRDLNSLSFSKPPSLPPPILDRICAFLVSPPGKRGEGWEEKSRGLDHKKLFEQEIQKIWRSCQFQFENSLNDIKPKSIGLSAHQCSQQNLGYNEYHK